MLLVICILIALFASFIGSISGIGGGIIIKPVLDLTGSLPIETVNFLSGITVLTMSTSSLIQTFIGRKKSSNVTESSDQDADGKLELNNQIQQQTLNLRQIVFLSLGSIIGGFIGTAIFSYFMQSIGNQALAVLVQAIVILLITIIVMIYQANKKRITTKSFTGFIPEISIGFTLGIISSFLGIGGGPLNIAVLAFFFSMSPKIAALSSLTIIFSAQTVSLLTTLISNKIPEFNLVMLIGMMISGVLGALVGRYVAKKLSDAKTDSFFNVALWLILAINLYNVVKNLV